ncbi:non-ribosomal peptide synthetase [Clostridium sp. C8-1-8]|uniref:non-ribosomal peptide synthetase n=1 Tax=Clostridium sp. C8-1-8 TaxID=2698831 RepID=UPI00136906B2|nr:non-ribosomal peptide synthetase [Clostridium sp. C8-1-8]
MRDVLKYIVESNKSGSIDKETAVNLIKMLRDIQHGNSRDIAIIGMAVNMPMAKTIDEYWDNIKENKDCVSEFPECRKRDIDEYLNFLGNTKNKQGYIKGAFLEEIDKFDYDFFKISPNEARLIDPNQRLFLETAWKAIEDAGYTKKKISGSKTGIYIGYSTDVEYNYFKMLSEVYPDMIDVAAPGNITSLIPGRLAYILNLKGPSMVIDTACSSSLVSIHLACKALQNGECDMAIAGGIKINLFPLYDKVKIGMESPSFKTKTFDDFADGTALGEGGGVILIKPLDKALRDKDNIYAVIKGSAINQDGAAAGITAPNVESQTQVIVDAWRDARIQPETISYIEIHGTGTKLGDSVEAEGIKNAFCRFTDKEQFCAVSTLKGSVGHLYEASGVAAVIKAVLSLKNKKLPPMYKAKTINSSIDFDNTAIYINDELRKWNSEDSLRRCGVSSFSVSGTNCHMVLEEAPKVSENNIYEGTKVMTISAESKEALRRLISIYIEILKNEEDTNLGNICFTSNVGRTHFKYRAAFFAENIDEFIYKLSIFNDTSNEFFNNIDEIKSKIDMKNEISKDANRKLKEYSLGNKDGEYILSSVCELYVRGAEVDWGILYEGKSYKIVSIPTYPFDKKRVWINLSSTKNHVKYKENEGDVNIGLQIKNIWLDVLGFEDIDVNEDFFNLGGNSIIAIKILNLIQQRLKVSVSINEFVNNRSIKALTKFLESSGSKNDNNIIKAFEPIKKIEKAEYYSVSSAQKRIMIMNNISNIKTIYNICTYFEIHGIIDKSKLYEAFNKLIKRHEILRTYFDFIDGVPFQKIEEEVISDISYYVGKEVELQSIIDSFIKPFNLKDLPLFRVGILSVKEDKHFLILDIHHIISDGTSIGVLIRELFSLYNDEKLHEPKIQYKDFVYWQNNILLGSKIKKQEEYWLETFKEQVPVLNLPTDRQRSAIQTYQGDAFNFKIDNILINKLKLISIQNETTLYSTLLTAYICLLWRLTGQTDIVVGTPVSGRIHQDIESGLGIFINTLPIRSNIKVKNKFKEILKSVSENIFSALENQSYQFEMLVDKLNIQRDLSRNPLFDTMFVLQDKSYMGRFESKDITVIPHAFYNHTSNYDITFEVIEENGEYRLIVEYCSDLFNKSTIERFGNYFINILKIISDNPNIGLQQIEMIDDKERETLLYKFNSTSLSYLMESTISQLFENRVEVSPKNKAIVFKEKELSYEEINNKANRLAVLLRKDGIKPNDIVGIMVRRSPEMIIGMLAVLKAGGAYLPIDPDYPRDRINYILEDSGTKLLLTQKELLSRVDFTGKCIDLVNEEAYGYRDYGNLEVVNNAKDVAYVIYTSGSTGKPKGVMIEHMAVNNFIKGITDIIDFRSEKTILNLTTISFDIFVLESLLPLISGVKVVIADEEEQMDATLIDKLIVKNRIDMIQATPSRIKLLIESGSKLNCFRYLKEIMIGGEALQYELLKQIKSVYDGKIFNMYGPTETTVWSMVKELTNTDNITIGKPIANTQIYILDEENSLQPIGVSGELCIGGDGLARGYFNRTDLTDEKFIESPFEKGKRIYKTGDLAKWLPNGEVEFLGRMDQQVKIRGYRIELGEIETILSQHNGIKECVVTARDSKEGYKYLAAYYMSDEEISVSELRDHISRELPSYMIPAYFVRLEKMPLTPNGKIDRKVLPQPKDAVKMSLAQYKEPTTQVEKILVSIWKDILTKSQIGINDNFFELGGNSLLLMKMQIRIDEIYPNKVKVADVFAYPTIASLSEFINKHEVLKIKKQKLKSLQLPKQYFVIDSEENEDLLIKFNTGQTIFDGISRISYSRNIQVEKVLLSLYIYLLHDISGKNKISVEVALASKDAIFSAEVDFSNLKELEDLIVNVSNICEEVEQDNLYGINDISYEKNINEELIVPIFVSGKDISEEFVDVYDLVFRVDQEDNDLFLSFEYNAKVLRKSKVEDMAHRYRKLLKTVILEGVN